jgi:hypothetical protein
MGMVTWTSDELDRIGTAEELSIASLRLDGTLRKPVTIWVVRLGGDLYVRSVNGRTSGWFRGTQQCHEGHIQAGGVDKDVAFEEVADNELLLRIDAVYRTKYHKYAPQYVDPLMVPEARSATIKLMPQASRTTTR